MAPTGDQYSRYRLIVSNAPYNSSTGKTPFDIIVFEIVIELASDL